MSETKEIKDGGPAYPVQWMALYPENNRVIEHVFGMSLRDYFAGQALIGYLSFSAYNAMPHERAKSCYEIADAMLSERERGKAGA